jgi:hypothetical protein
MFSRGLLKEGFHFLDSFPLHRGKHMRIDVCRHIQRAMTQDPLDHFEVDPHTSQQCRRTMPQVVNMYLGQPQFFQQPIKAPSNGVGPQLSPMLRAKDEIMMLPGWTGPQASFLLPCAMSED